MAVSVPPEAGGGNLPPQNVEAETSVLGAVLLTEQALDGVLLEVGLRPDDFYRPRHQLIFASFIRLKEKAEPEAIDALTVCDDLRRAGELETAGGEAYVHSLPTLVPAVGNVLHYARIVKEYALLRRLLGATREIQEEVVTHGGSPRELIERAESKMFQIGHEGGSGEMRSIETVLHEEIDKLEELSRKDIGLTGTPSGFLDLDNLTGGFQPGNLIVLAARPSMGKCLTGSTLVYNPQTGARRPMREVVESVEAGNEEWVASLSPQLRLRPTPVSRAFRNGVKPVFRLTTRLGRQIEATANHPLYTVEGWRPLEELTPGDLIAVPASLPSPRSEKATAPLPPPPGSVTVAVMKPATASPLGEVAWDAVEGVEPIGDEETFDIEVPEDHSFVANDIVVHNSALATNIAENAAVKFDRPVALFSLEMSETELAHRFIASQARLSSDELRKGRVKGDRWPKVLKAVEKLARAPLYVDDSSDIGILEMRAKARRLHARRELGLVIVDYLQLMRPEGRADSRVEQIGQISRGLKILARELEIPVIAISQLSRAVESRNPPTPMLSDLRECVTAETLVTVTDGPPQPIADLVGSQPDVLAVNDGNELIPAYSDKVWCVGRRPVLRLDLACGKVLRGTAKHRVRTDRGWVQLGDLMESDHVAVAFEASVANAIGGTTGGTAVVGAALAERVDSATQDVFWDRVVSIEPDGEEDVYDLTVPGPACWLADGIVTHNSGQIEQDADLVMFVYRDEYYNKESERLGEADIIIAKHRNGPIGDVTLTFQPRYPKFTSVYREPVGGGPGELDVESNGAGGP